MTPAHATAGENWLETHDYLATWLQGVGTLVAVVAVIVTLEHFRRAGFRLRVKDVAKDTGSRCVELTVENTGRTDGRVDRIYGGRLTRPSWRPARWKDFEIDPSVRVRVSDSAPDADSPLPLTLAGATAEDLVLYTDFDLFAKQDAAVAVIASGRRKLVRLRRVKSEYLFGCHSTGPADDQEGQPPDDLAEAGQNAVVTAAAEQPPQAAERAEERENE